MKNFRFKKRCKLCREVIEPGYKYIAIPDKDEYFCEECVDNMKSQEFLAEIEADQYSVYDLMDIFDIELVTEEAGYGEYDCI